SFPSSRRQREDARHLLPTFARYDRPFIAATHRVARPRPQPSLVFHPSSPRHRTPAILLASLPDMASLPGAKP
uniref:Uncharacterized protein n=1 Tax=Triticum urartu TaxID=4572 RepID=A0A8R7PWA1_TRIUA